MRTITAFSAAILTVTTSAAMAHPGHGTPVTDVQSLVLHWLDDPVHAGALLLTGVAAAVSVGLLARRERARARTKRRD